MIADLVRLVETDNEVAESYSMEDGSDSEVLSERVVTEVESSTSITLSEDESTDDVTSLDDSEETSESEDDEEGRLKTLKRLIRQERVLLIAAVRNLRICPRMMRRSYY